MEWPKPEPQKSGGGQLPSLGGVSGPTHGLSRGSAGGLAPLTTSNMHFPRAGDDQGQPQASSRSHRSSHGAESHRSVGPSSGGHGVGSSRGQMGKFTQSSYMEQPPPSRHGAMPVSQDQQPQSARQIRSSGGPREPHQSSRGSMTARPSSKGVGLAQQQRQSAANMGGQQGGSDKARVQEQLPVTPAKVLKYHIDELTEFEQGEILDFPQVWYFGVGAQKVRGTSAAANNHGYDDERGDYLIVLHDHILYRFEVMNPLGKGSFGQVVRTFDFKNNAYCACKVIRNKKRFHHQALVEVKILEHICERDLESTANVVHMMDYFYFRNHLCITFELLSINLYEFIKNNNFQGVSLGLIRRFAIQLLTALRFLRKQHIIHCDFKPENVLLKNPTKSGIKVIDFGSSCFEDERVYTYIQSRFYRSPEVILGIPYDVAIDMWSFGCILAELYTGYPLFPGENEVEQLACIMEVCNVPPPKILENATRIKMFFDSAGNPRLVPNSRGKQRRPGSKDMQSVLRTSETKYVDFLTGCLQWDPRERFSPEDALQHEWILEGYAKHAAQRDPRGQEYGSHPEQSAPQSSQSKRHGGHSHGGHGGSMASSKGFSATSQGFGNNRGGLGNTTSGATGGGSSFVFPPIGGSENSKSHKARTSKGGPLDSTGGLGATGTSMGGLGGVPQQQPMVQDSSYHAVDL
eukprot:gnl/TRDRNA2_/TRDRNA2_185014_c0_seq1.p1 gnl/TRDRNA2_/TRDRNA2_185014_c0~~gnl/TRDRNA2_/TRDRNA2_185014_c0_seq1.p1  ORF type:complete len:689 (+),score=115.12 gnl/TRDRNA2_/TRDRNA2_185014_c0_seq1:100-2166(+)